MKLSSYVLDCPDPAALAKFYAALLGWSIKDQDDEWVTLRNPDGAQNLAFQRADEYVAPTWPQPQRPQMAHLDFQVARIADEHDRTLQLGARLVDDTHDSFWVYTDPAGHPFCLCNA